MTHLKIRKLFKDFFVDHSHAWLDSASLVPHKDPSLLFVNAGMNPFKNVFLGIEPVQNQNIASIQKCMRAGGKHNDLEQVGSSAFHHTFFEMMGNFSFGGYFKEEACRLAWTFLTQKLQLPQENLGVSVFEKDLETAKIWEKLNVPKERIFFFGEEDNFWRMGDEGPCGPCSEIYFSPDGFRSGTHSMFEVWNLVFMEYYENKNKKQKPLNQKCIDTGMGLERLAHLLENKTSNFHTDLFQPILEQLGRLTQVPYQYIPPSEEKGVILQNNLALRVLADHIRSACFLIGDGVYPSNEGRGYILRRLLRRALYYKNRLSEKKSILSQAVKSVMKVYSDVYPDLVQQKNVIARFLDKEEDKFLYTLEQGQSLLEKQIYDLQKKNQSVLPGEICFKLYDTYGFPFDLVELICHKKNVKADIEGFQKSMEKARTQSRQSSRFEKAAFKEAIYDEKTQFPKGFDPQKSGMFFIPSQIKPSQFTGYENLISSSQLMALFDKDHKNLSQVSSSEIVFAVFDQTCFYAEGGGQVGDQGVLVHQKSGSTSVKAVIKSCQNIHGYYFHELILKEGVLNEGKTYELCVSSQHREQTAVHHSATHLLHSALRKVLGVQTKQAGSLVMPDKLRFDFTSPEGLSEKQLFQVEDLVNEQILNSVQVAVSYKKYEQALKDGALSFFEKPSLDKVRVLKMGDFSHELCGGTHVNNTSEIRSFKILSESSVSSGVRRIEAVAGRPALELLVLLSRENLKARRYLNVPVSDGALKTFPLLECVEKQKSQIRNLKKSKPVQKPADFKVETFLLNSQKASFYCAVHPLDQQNALGTVVDQVKKSFPLVVAVAVGESSAKKQTPIVVALPKIISEKISPQMVIQKLGGKGGGPALFAKGALSQSVSQKTLRNQVLKILHSVGFAKELGVL